MFIIDKEQLANENYGLVHYVAKSFYNTMIDYDELVSVANLGYAKALNSFDIDKNVKFSTYAVSCMRNEIMYFLRLEKKYLDNYSLDKVIAIDKHGHEQTMQDTLSLDFYIDDDVIKKEEFKWLHEKIEEIEDGLQQVIVDYYFNSNTQQQIAKKLNITQTGVSLRLKKALRKLEDKLTA